MADFLLIQGVTMITRVSEVRDFPISIWGLQRLPNCAIAPKMLVRVIAIQ